MTDAPVPTPAGWYPAPDGSSTRWWWDGTRWIQPQQPVSPSVPASNAIAKLAVATQILVIVYGVVTVGTILNETMGIFAATSFLDGNEAAIDSLDAYDRGTSVVSILSSLSLIAAGVLWVIWQYRVAKQVAGLTRRSAGWHAGSWFIPIISLWYPYENISDLWRAVGRTRPAWQILWWLLWIASNAAIQISTRVYLAAEDIEQFRVAMWTSLAGAILILAAVPFALLIIRGITKAIVQPTVAPADSPSV
jgi:hypothetical protein